MKYCIECKKELKPREGVYSFNEWYCEVCYRELYTTKSRKHYDFLKQPRFYAEDDMSPGQENVLRNLENDGWDGTS